MERLALALWVALSVGTLAGGSGRDHQVASLARFPKLPVPAGASLSEAPVDRETRLFYDQQLARTQVACTNCYRS